MDLDMVGVPEVDVYSFYSVVVVGVMFELEWQ